jgi:hypothetical protein
VSETSRHSPAAVPASKPATYSQSSTVVEVLERVLDKGVVIVGDIGISLCDIELLKIKLRLLICSVDKAKELGIDWWEREPAFSSRAQPEAVPSPQSPSGTLER